MNDLDVKVRLGLTEFENELEKRIAFLANQYKIHHDEQYTNCFNEARHIHAIFVSCFKEVLTNPD